MKLLTRDRTACATALAVACALVLTVSAQTNQGAQAKPQEYLIKPLPPGGPPPRLADGHVDFSGHWLPNGAGQGVSGRFGVDPAAMGQFDRRANPEEAPSFQPWAIDKMKNMTPTEKELAKSSVNCMPRGVPAIWLGNPYSTMIVHTPKMMAQLYEVLNNWRLIHTDGRPIPKSPEPWFHGNSTTHWDGDTLVVDSEAFDERTYIRADGWFHSDQLHVTERYSRPSMNYLMVQIKVDDPKVLTKPWNSATRRWTLGNGEVYEFYCDNNHEVEELNKLKEIESKGK